MMATTKGIYRMASFTMADSLRISSKPLWMENHWLLNDFLRTIQSFFLSFLDFAILKNFRCIIINIVKENVINQQQTIFDRMI
jgi:hypothetical protein